MTGQQPEFIFAAGGLLWREVPNGLQLLIVHRKRYDDWSLPKGKLDQGELWQQAALREVKEETNLEAKIDSFAGVVAYHHKTRPKVVLFWNMTPLKRVEDVQPVSDTEPEVDEMRWLDVDTALEKLSYPGEVALVRSNREQITSAQDVGSS